MIVVIAILAALLIVMSGVAYLLRSQVQTERRFYAIQVAEYARRDAENRKLTIAAIDRRLVLDGSIPTDEPLREELPPDEPETIEDVARLLAAEEEGGLSGRGRIAERRELIKKLRDLEETQGSPTARTVAQPVPYDPTLNVVVSH